MNEIMTQMLMQRMGGPQQFQSAMNAAQQALAQCNVSMEQFMQNPQGVMNQLVQSGAIPQDKLNQAIQQANNSYPRR